MCVERTVADRPSTNMKIVIAIDSFKGSLSSLDAGEAVRDAFIKIFPGGEAVILPIADGGEGTTDALVRGLGGEFREVEVTGPLGERKLAQYGVIGDTAVIEMASAAGLPSVPADRRDPECTTTYGVGELICHALNSGCRDFIVGIGGSATNDGGIGMMTALGCGFFDENGDPVGVSGGETGKIRKIDLSNLDPRVKECKFRVACDVTNPLCGENGASAVFGPQKGATPKQVKSLDAGLRNLSQVVAKTIRKDVSNTPGAGAAGGLGFALMAFFNAELRGGVEMILDKIDAATHMKNADIVVTGEGRMDAQTAMGKAPAGVAKLAKASGAKLVLAFAGSTKDADSVNDCGIDAYFAIPQGVATLDELIENARGNLYSRAVQVFRVVRGMMGYAIS